MWEVSYRLRVLSQMKGIEVYFKGQNNMMSYFDLYTRALAEVKKENGEHSSLNQYLTFYESLEDPKRIFTQDVAIRAPDEGCDVTTLEVGEDQQQVVEKVLVRLHDVETEFSSQGACVVISQDKDCKHIIAVFNKSMFQKEQSMADVFSKGKPFYIHYPVYPSLIYRYTSVPPSAEEPPKAEIDETQLYE
jgi:hypothetical protein